MFENLKNLLLTPLSFWSQKRYHEISKLGGEYSPFEPSYRTLSSKEAYTGWVYTAVTSIAGGVAKLPFHLLNDRDKQIDHEYLKLIDYTLLEGITSHLKLSGTVYIWKNTIGGRVRSLTILQSSSIEPEWDKSKTVILKYKYWLNGKSVSFKPEEIIVIMSFNPLQAYPYQTRGFSEIQASAISIDTDNAQSVWNWKEFENGATPGTVLSTDKSMQQESIENIRTQWNNKFKGVNNAKKLAILTDGLKHSVATMTPKDMEYIEGKRMTRDEILAIFKVPKAVLGLGDGAGGNMNIRAYQEIFSRNAIEPVAIRIQHAFNKDLFKDIGRFEFYNIVPHDEATVRADYQSGITTLNEARSMRGFSPIKGGNVFYLDSANPAEDVEPKGIEAPENMMYKSIASSIVNTMTKGTEEFAERKIKARDKRLSKYEILIKKAVGAIADQQASDIISSIKDEKALKLPDLNFKKYSTVWLMKLKNVYQDLVESEGNVAIQEVGVDTAFKVGSPEVAKMIKSNIYLLASSVDSTTKSKLQRIFEVGVNEGIGAQEMRDRIKTEFVTLSTSRTEAIARTETIRMSNEASIEGWDQSEVVEKKQWWTALDDRVSPFDKSLHGKIIKLRENFFKKWDSLKVGDEILNLNYSDTPAPPLHPNCRCTIIPIIKP